MADYSGNIISNGSNELKLWCRVSDNGGKTTQVDLYVYTKYSVIDKNNTLTINWCNGSSTYKGSTSISTGDNANALIATYTTENQSWSIQASLTGIDHIGSSKITSLDVSGTTWTSVGKPTKPSIIQNDDLSITISGRSGDSGKNNSVKDCHVYYKWNASTVSYGDYTTGIAGCKKGDNYQYTIPAETVINARPTSVAVIVYTVGTCDNNGSEVNILNNIKLGGVIDHVPYRYYFNDSSDDGFRENTSDPVSADNYVSWIKNNGSYFDLIISQPNINKDITIVEKTENNKIDLNENKLARQAALSCMSNSNCVYYYGNGTNKPSTGYSYPLLKYYDATITLKSYNSNKTYISSYSKTIRIALNCPYEVPGNFKVTYLDGDDFGYEHNGFKANWDKVPNYCNQYIISYKVQSPTDKTIYSEEKYIIVKGNEANFCDKISIPSLLSGQKVSFFVGASWYGEIDGTSFEYDAPKDCCATFELQKQGGMIVKTNSGYQNCHVCVVDNNGKLVKALATYVYADKDGSKTEKEWRLMKMNS